MMVMDPVEWHPRQSTLLGFVGGIVGGSVGGGVWRGDGSGGGYHRWWVWGGVGLWMILQVGSEVVDDITDREWGCG